MGAGSGTDAGTPRGLRAAAAVLVSLIAFGALVVFGGLGGVVAVTAASAQYEYGGKVMICHRSESSKKPDMTITVSADAVDVHLAHGDIVGPCPA
jgi:hypothetical protein